MTKKFDVRTFGNDFIITVLEEGKYLGTPVKIVNLHFSETDEKHEPEFEIELPKNKTELFKDNEFLDMISEMVGELISKSTDALLKSQTELMEIEVKVGDLLKKNNVKYDENKLLVEQFMAKDFILHKDKEKDVYLATDVKTNESFDLSNPEQFELVRQKVFPNIILSGVQ